MEMNMKNKIALLGTILLTTSLFAGIKSELPKEPFSTLKLDQETYLSDAAGVLNPYSIINLIPSNNVKIYLGDGTVVTGMVKEVTMINKEIFKVFGEITNKDNVGFGFALSRDGVFAGAVVFRNTQEVYTVQYSEEAKGYVFVKSLGKKLLPSS